MTSTRDVDLVTRLAKSLPRKAVVVEIGPWLGAISDVLAPKAQLHAVDSFVWTKDHAKRVPDLLKPGESFRVIYQKLMEKRDHKVSIHETPIEAFKWTGGAIDMCVIDAPKKPDLLRDALRALASGLREGSCVVIKNANHLKYFPMMAYLQALVDQGALSVVEADDEGACNTIAFEQLVSGKDLTSALAETPLDHPARWRLVEGGLGDLGPFQLALICELIGAGEWTQAYEVAGRMQPSRRVLRDWDRREAELANAGADPEQLGWFAEIMGLQHSKGGLPAPPKSISASPAMARRAYWINNRDKPWRARAFHPEVFERAHQYGYMKWINSVQEHIQGQDVLDVGCGPGLHGFACLAVGAKSYLGLDPIIKLDRDRVKNVSAGSAKMEFGWTPAALSEKFEPWDVRATAIEELPEERVFDIAVLHNVTEHLQTIESVFEAIALRLKPTGKILYNHHNFYCWNGHHLPPKVVSKIDPSDPSQLDMVDWGHVEYDPAPEHYIARGLNRIRLDDLIALTERYFDIEVSEERPSRPDTGLGRLNDEVRLRYPYLEDRDFETQNLFCIAKVKT
jgi:SAM-dependent methyltransferase